RLRPRTASEALRVVGAALSHSALSRLRSPQTAISRRKPMHNRRMFLLGAAGTAAAVTLAACGGEGAGSGGPDPDAEPSDLTVGVGMPTQTYERWVSDGNNIKEGLEEKGYTVDMQYADDDIPTQQQQLDQMITQEVDVLIIASIDGSALSAQLDAAAAAGIPTIAYDRLLTDS